MYSRLRGVLGTLAIVSLIAPLTAGASVQDAPVADAAMRQDAERVRTLLLQGADVNAAQGDGMTALHWAAQHGDADLASVLLYAGAHRGAATRIGAYTPLLVAARQGRVEVARVLVDAGAGVGARTANGTTALMLAAASGDAPTVRVLLAAGADPNAVDGAQGQTALMFAAAGDRVDAIAALIGGGADPSHASAVVDIVERENAMRAAARRRAQVEAALREIDAPPETDEPEEGEESAEGEVPGAAVAGETAEKAEAARLADEVDPELGERPLAVTDAELAADPELSADPQLAAELAADPELSATDPQVLAAQAEAAEVEAAGSEEGDEGAEEEPERPRSYGQLVGATGGMTPLLHAVRQGHAASTQALLELGADVDQTSAGDGTSPLLIAAINGHFDLAMYLLEQGADPGIASAAGATPLYAAINVRWAPHSFYPQPSPAQQRATHLELMEALLAAGADPNARLDMKLWYTGYNFDQDGVDATGATAFWRAAQSGDVEAMKLLVAYGAEPTLTTRVVPRRRLPNGRNADRDLEVDPPKVGDPAVDALHAAAGAGYDGNFHVTHPAGRMPAVRYLVEELGFDVNRSDDEGYTPLHAAAARGDNEMVLFLVSHGADVTAVSANGETTADMANGPVQRIQPFPETVALLESLGSENNHNCVSC